ncbi:hypothetical protein R5W24_006209, partial [Gemmata sp. JC717]
MNKLKFSQKMGFSPLKSVQVEGMDSDLRTALWNALNLHFNRLQTNRHYARDDYAGVLSYHLWVNVLKQPQDRMPGSAGEFLERYRALYF